MPQKLKKTLAAGTTLFGTGVFIVAVWWFGVPAMIYDVVVPVTKVVIVAFGFALILVGLMILLGWLVRALGIKNRSSKTIS